jgi:hypothetical protein
MIFLAVSGFIFVSAMTLMSGKQNKTEFDTGIAQLTSQLQTVIGNVVNGYYSIPNNFHCSAVSNGTPSITYSYGSSRGTNEGCIFIGEVIQFDPSPLVVPSAFNQPYMVYPIVGDQYQGSSQEVVTNFTYAYPLPIYTDSNPSADEETLPYGITISYMDYTDSSTTNSPHDYCDIVTNAKALCVGAVGIFSTFNGQANSAGGSPTLLQNGSQSVEIVPIPPTSTESQLVLSLSPDAVKPYIEGLRNSATSNILTDHNNSSTVIDPDGGVRMCFNSGSDSESGLVTVGGINSPSLVTLNKFSHPGCV